MKRQLSLLAVALLLAQPVLAKDIPLNRAAALANSVTPAASSQAYDDLEQQALAQLRHALQGDAATLTRDRLAHTKQNQTQADTAWLKASGYDFQTRANQQAGIALLSAFSTLPETVVKQNLATVTAINRDAVQTMRRQALADAEGISYLYFLSDALGPRLGKAFLTAYDQGALGKAAALIKASEVSTGEAKKHFNNPRPFLVQGNTIHLVPDDVVVKDNQPYTADGGSFPSGHTNTGYTDALLLAAMIPERYDALVARGARYGYSRIVLGVHYPLDVIGSRMVAERNVAHYLNDPHYRVLFNEARDQLRAALAKACGTSLAECAKSSVKDDPWRDPAMRDFSRFTMTYDLPQQKGPQPRLQVPEGAEVLLEDALPHLSAAQRRALMVNTALPAGYPLSGTTPEQQFWQRLNLSAAWEMAQKKALMWFPARCTACRAFPATGGLIAAIPRLTHRPSLKFPQLSPILDLMHKRRTRASFTLFNRTAHMTNPLLTPFSLPPFSAIKPEHVVPAVTKALEDCRAAVESAVAHGAPYSWENLCQPLAEVDDVLGRIFSPVSHLNSVKNSPELREAYEQTLPLLSEYSTWVGQHEGLYKAYRDLRDGDNYATLNTAQKKAVDNALRDFELSGIGLPPEAQKRYGEIAARLSELGNQYSNNVLDATMGWNKLVTDVADLAACRKARWPPLRLRRRPKSRKGIC